ncbi:MAG: hypothetical protein M3N19_07205 [Candidatus Eremiobacteraeota bacterium]|nr:hypothetical protein [Candidatus Eremiobacteraeota bacterium]
MPARLLNFRGGNGEKENMAGESGTVLGGALSWFKDKLSKPKPLPPRKSGAFHMWLQVEPGKYEPGVGMEIAVDSMIFIIEQEITTPDFTVVARVRERNIPIHVRSTVHDQVPNKGTTWNRYGCTYVGVAADHWDLIYRYVNDVPEPENARAGEEFKVDDAYRMLPLEIQHKIVALLVEQKKLLEPKAGQSPLLKLFSSGERKMPSGGTLHFFSIHSRALIDDEMMAYDTRISVDEKGEVTVQK